MSSTCFSRPLVPLGFCIFLVLFHGCLSQLTAPCMQTQQSSRLSGRSDCQIDRIIAREPNRRVESEAGVSEFWDTFENDELECAGVEAVRHTINPKGLLLPYYPSAPELVYVVRGRGLQGTVLPGCPETFETSFPSGSGQQQFSDKHQKVYRYKEGDILALPAGSVHWTYNDGETPIVTIVLRDTSNVANQLDRNFRKFFLAGNPQSQQVQYFGQGPGQQQPWGQPGSQQRPSSTPGQQGPWGTQRPSGSHGQQQQPWETQRPSGSHGQQQQPWETQRPGSQRPSITPGQQEPWGSQRPSGSQQRPSGSQGSQEPWGSQPHHSGSQGSQEPWGSQQRPSEGSQEPWGSQQRPSGSHGQQEPWESQHSSGSHGQQQQPWETQRPGSQRPSITPGQQEPWGSQRPSGSQQGSQGSQEPWGSQQRPSGSHGQQQPWESQRPSESHSEQQQPWETQRPGSQRPSITPGQQEPWGSQRPSGSQQGSQGSQEPWGSQQRPSGSHGQQQPWESQRPSESHSEQQQPWETQRPGSQRPSITPGQQEPWGSQRPSGSQQHPSGSQGSQEPWGSQQRPSGSHGQQQPWESHRPSGSQSHGQQQQPWDTQRPSGSGSQQRPSGSQGQQQPWGSQRPSGSQQQPWGSQRPSGGSGQQADPCELCRRLRGKLGLDSPCAANCNEFMMQQGQADEGFNIFSGFDEEILQMVFNVEYDTVSKLQGQYDNRGLIVYAENFQVVVPEEQEQQQQQFSPRGRGNGLEETLCSTQLSANIASPTRADVYNPRGGRISKLNSFKLPVLNMLQLSAERGVLYKNAVLAPHYNLNAHSIIYVTSGSSRLQIVRNDGSSVFDDVVREGQLIVVPQDFAVIKKAGEEGCEWIAFKTNENAMTTQLAGRFSYIRELPEEVLVNSYNISRQQAKSLKYNRQEGVVLSPQSGSTIKKAKNTLLNAIFG